MAKTVKVKYVGRKPMAVDNVAYSGKCWRGNGDVQEVTPGQAAVLVKYPDQWALFDDGDSTKVPEAKPAADGEVNALGEGPALESMTKTQLADLAARNWGEKLPASLSKKAMVDAIEELQRAAVDNVE